MGRFEGKVCIIAGGARGIGGKTAELYAAEGGRVLIGDMLEEEGRALAARLGPGRAAFHRLDVTDPASCRAAVERAAAEFGGADHLVNCAIRMAPGALLDLPAESWKRVVDVGLHGTFFMCQAFGQWLIPRGRPGAVVNLSSSAGLMPYTLVGAYSTVKAGIIMLSQQLALEWARRRIRVNAVCPGHTETPLTAAYLADPEVRRGRSEVTPWGRIGQPGDIAHGVLYLLSEEADYVTAIHLDIDGGLTRSIFNHLPGRKWD